MAFISKLTRVIFCLVLTMITACCLFLLYAKFSETDFSRRQPSLEPKKNATYETGQKPAHQVVAEYVKTLERNTGRTAVPETDLPYSREDIRQAIISAPKWAKDFYSPGGNNLFAALLIELENFVPDSQNTAQEYIGERQRNLIAQFGHKFVSPLTYKDSKSIPIGGAQNALAAMLFEREAQDAGFLAVFVFFGFLGVKLLLRFLNRLRRRPRDSWSDSGLKWFFVLGLFTGAVGYPVAWLLNRCNNMITSNTMIRLGIGFAVLVPLLILSTLFDILVYPGINRLPNTGLQPTPKSDTADADH